MLVFLCAFLGSGLFASDIIDVELDGRLVNDRIHIFIDNIARLIPDSVTTQNVWSYAPRSTGGVFGFGVNGSFTMSDRTMISRLDQVTTNFGGKEADLNNIPESIHYLPALSLDVRFGGRNYDFGIAGMWANSDMSSELAVFFGEDSDYTHRTIGFDFRYALATEGISAILGFPITFISPRLMPSITLQAGYYFTWLSVGFANSMEASEKFNIDFRNDSYFAALQLTKSVVPGLLTLFGGTKLIASSTVSEFSWETYRVTKFEDRVFPLGVIYESGTNTRDTKHYLHLYGGIGLSFIFDHFLTLGFAYNVHSQHFAVTGAVRILYW